MKRVQIALAVIFLLLMSCDNVFHTLANKDPNKDNSIIIGVEGGIIVKFDKNGGETEADPDAIIVWAPVRTIGGLPVDPAWTDYTFLGWNTMPDGTGTGFTSSTTVLSDIVVYAQWVLNTYTVSFYANGASGNAPPAQTVDAASAITLPDEGGLSKPGYFFGGWNTKEDGSGINCSANSLLIVTGSLSLYALWVEIGTVTHTVLFDSNGGTAVPGQIVISGNQAARPQNPSRSGYSFVNWYSDSGLGAVYDFSAPVTENITLFAGWNIVQYTVTFNINGAEGTVPESRTVNAGSEIILPDNTGISKGDYLFGGWNANAAGTGINYSAHGVLVPDSTITLYAKWNPPGTVTHTVSFDSNGGSAVSGQTVISGLSAKRPSDPVRTNYIFSNWYGDDSLASLYSFSNPVTEDITVYAKWNRIQYTVRFSVNGGSGT
ncbi:MAG: InlB B-repeat-containing protein, partial [Treponema sp.]|nr:InlB B-repeat-containing protein [Treponema sp.]